MADQLGDAPLHAAAVQQGQAAGANVVPDAKQANTGEKKQGKGKQPNRRGAKPGEHRLAEIGAKGHGFVKLIKENFGFISSPDLDEQLFFHATELLPPEGGGGPAVPFAERVAAGDEVEFVVGQNTGKRSNFVAKQVKKLAVHTVKAQLLSEERYLGTVVKEMNSGQWRSEDSSAGEISYQAVGAAGKLGKKAVVEFLALDARHLRRNLLKGTLVEFNLCTDNQTQQQRAVHIEVKAPPRPAQDGQGGAPLAAEPIILHGFIKSLKPQTGLIRCIEREETFVFKKSDVPPQHQDKIQAGAEVMFNLLLDPKGNHTVISLAVLASGTLTAERVSEAEIQGRVIRPINPPWKENPEDGLIALDSAADRDISRVAFKAMPLEGSQDDSASLRIDDEVELRLVTNFRTDRTEIRSLRLICRAAEKRELGQVRTLKGNFGFIKCCQRSADLFFHYTTLQGCTKADLKKGDDLEFSVERNPEHGTIAVKVKKMPPGSAVFETVSEEEHTGIVQTPVTQLASGTTAYESVNGVISFKEGGEPVKILYGAQDFKEKVAAGDHVVFRIANNINAAKAAEQLGVRVTRLVGRRATQGSLLKLSGTVKQSKGSYGFLKYAAKDGNERTAFYHSSEVKDGAALKPGDEVAFTLWDNPKTKELNARKIVRTQEAAEAPAEQVAVGPAPSERKPLLQNSSKLGGNASSNPTVRMAAMPDGTRGFHLGRGRGLEGAASASKPSAPVEIPRAPGKPVGRAGQISGGRSLGGTPQGRSPGLRKAQEKGLQQTTKFGSAEDRGGSTVASPLTRSLSGRGLNPAAPTFMPKTPSANQLLPAAEPAQPVILNS